MDKFTVSIDEVISHVMTIEASDADDAVEIAKTRLEGIITRRLIPSTTFGYRIKSVGLTGKYTSTIKED